MTTSIQKFLRKHPIFSYQDFVSTLLENGARSPYTIKALLTHHLRHGHIVRIRRGLLGAIPIGADAKAYVINPYLIAGYATEDAVIAYHTALSFHQVAYSMNYRLTYLTNHQTIDFSFRSETYIGVLFPPALIRQNQTNHFVNTEDVQGLNIRVTNLERTLVDVLDKPVLGGGWEEIWRSLSLIERIRVDRVVEYALLLSKPTTIAKVGFYLSLQQAAWHIPSEVLETLCRHRPAAPYYIDASAKQNGQFIADWNIIVPKNLIAPDWEE